MPEIAVFYLARLKDGFAQFETFAQTYRHHPSGVDHDLIIICKGFTRRSEYAVLASIFKGIPHQVTSVDDSVGQDIHAYKIASARFKQTYMCFLNTYSEIRADDWLKNLYLAIEQSDVGLAGASASFESLNNSWEVLDTFRWLLTTSRYDSKINRSFKWMISSFHPSTGRALHSIYRRIRRFVGDRARNRPKLKAALKAYPQQWRAVSGKGGYLNFASKFPHFPNPHIRSNAFIVRRDDIVKAPLLRGDHKIACCNFESGVNGLSNRILRSGRRLVLVGADGKNFNIPEWMNAGSFRSRNQANLMVSDNQTKLFDTYSEFERDTHSVMTWGEYLKGNRRSLFNVTFDNNRPLSSFMPKPVRQSSAPLISIVIPTHNRPALTLDAIKTIASQRYDNWEICVFENASKDSLETKLSKIGDPRIKFQRSGDFLPVTASWNRAMSMATGEYVTLIGDDDGLAPGFFQRISDIVNQFERPDAIFSSLYQFFHPGVLPSAPLGFVKTLPMADFMARRDYPFVLEKSEARRSVDNSLALRRTFMFNMPAFTVSRTFLESLRSQGEILKPPFPDYYFANIVLERANRIVVEPRPIAFQGISTSSFGFTLFNQKMDDGFKVLGHDEANDGVLESSQRHLLPGNGYNSQYIMTMVRLAQEIGDPLRLPDFKRYRLLQLLDGIETDGFPISFRPTRPEVWSKLTAGEKTFAYSVVAANALSRFRFFRRASGYIKRHVSMHSFSPSQRLLNEGDFVVGSEVFNALESGRI